MSAKSPFIVNALELATTPQDFDVHSTAQELDLSRDDLAFQEPVRGWLSWRWMDGRAVLTGELATRAQTTCVRCLGEASVEIIGHIHVIFTDDPPAETDLFDLGDEDEAGLVHYLGDRIDAREEIRDILLLETTELPVCSPQCRGLCPHCGADLNDGPCDCPPEEPAPPSAAPQDSSNSWRSQLDQIRDTLE